MLLLEINVFVLYCCNVGLLARWIGCKMGWWYRGVLQIWIGKSVHIRKFSCSPLIMSRTSSFFHTPVARKYFHSSTMAQGFFNVPKNWFNGQEIPSSDNEPEKIAPILPNFFHFISTAYNLALYQMGVDSKFRKQEFHQGAFAALHSLMLCHHFNKPFPADAITDSAGKKFLQIMEQWSKSALDGIYPCLNDLENFQDFIHTTAVMSNLFCCLLKCGFYSRINENDAGKGSYFRIYVMITWQDDYKTCQEPSAQTEERQYYLDYLLFKTMKGLDALVLLQDQNEPTDTETLVTGPSPIYGSYGMEIGQGLLRKFERQLHTLSDHCSFMETPIPKFTTYRDGAIYARDQFAKAPNSSVFGVLGFEEDLFSRQRSLILCFERRLKVLKTEEEDGWSIVSVEDNSKAFSLD